MLENDQYLFCFYMDTFLLFNFFYSGKSYFKKDGFVKKFNSVIIYSPSYYSNLNFFHLWNKRCFAEYLDHSLLVQWEWMRLSSSTRYIKVLHMNCMCTACLLIPYLTYFSIINHKYDSSSKDDRISPYTKESCRVTDCSFRGRFPAPLDSVDDQITEQKSQSGNSPSNSSVSLLISLCLNFFPE